MRTSLIIARYVSKNFLVGVGVVLLLIASIILLFDTLETVRRSYNKEIPFNIIIEMVFLRFPHLVQVVMPYVVLIGGIMTFAKLTRSSELIVMRASGISVWQFLMPTVLTAIAIGIFVTTIFNPLSAIMLARFEQLEGKYLHGTTSLLSVSSSGLWLNEMLPDGKKNIIHALRVSQRDTTLYDVTIFQFSDKKDFQNRVDAKSARLEDNIWSMENAVVMSPNVPARRYPLYTLPTSIEKKQIQESFSSPETISFWELPTFIETLKEAGFSALRHLLHWHTLLISPFLLASMVFIAAAFSLRPPRRGQTGLLIVAGIILGFFIHFISNLVAALGLSGGIPVALAAWTPVLISILIGTAIMLHLEDG